MDIGIKTTLQAVTHSLTSRMAAFEKDLKQSSDTSPSPTLTTLAADFHTFRDFAVLILKTLETQVSLLAAHCDNLETRSRRKMLLIHGSAEQKDERPADIACSLIQRNLEIKDLDEFEVVRASRLGRPKQNGSRPMLVKFRSEKMRDRVWFNKTKLKGSGVTISEFLTQPRHSLFVSAREKLGVSRCWTQEGRIYASDKDGRKHRLTSLDDLNKINDVTTDPGPKSHVVDNGQAVSELSVPPNPKGRRVAS